MKKLLQSLAILMLFAFSAIAQERTVSGTVTGADGFPIPGATVRAKGTQSATQTSANGKYTLRVPASVNALEFISLGYISKTVVIGAESQINTVLTEDSKNLNEVIVIAYGTVKKENFTGSAATIGAKNFADRPTTSFEKALQGAAAGVQVTSVSGQPGATSAVRIRGVGSFTASSTPLYVVDGIAITNGDLSQVAQTSDVLSSLNPNDIASVTVLKDATAAAIYGSRAANGVVLITTKQGQSGNTKFTASVSGGYSSQAVKKHEVLDASEYYKVYFDNYYARRLAAGSAPDLAATEANKLTRDKLTVNPFNTPDPFGANGVLNPGASLLYDTDWRDEVLQRGVTKDVNIGASGGTDKLKYYVSGGYFDQKGIVIGSDFKRYTGKFNITNDVNKYISFGVTNTLSRSDQNTPAGAGGGANPVRFADIASNIYSLYVRDAAGNPILDATGKPVYSYVNPVSPDFNPVGLSTLDEYNTKTTRIITSPYIQVKFLKDFTAKSSIGIDYINNRERQFYNPLHGNGVSVTGRGYRYTREDITVTYVNTLTYDKTLGLHSLNVLLGQEAYRTKLDNIYAQATGFAFPDAEELVAASIPNTATSSFTEKRLSSYFSRLTYDYDKKYFLSGSFRRDGSSVFGPDNKYGNFYSIGGAWRISKEDFFGNDSFVNELKLRASYGTSGNDRIDRYGAQGLYTLGRNYEGKSGMVYTQLENKNLKWEQNATTDIGLEFAVLNNRISGEVSYYKRGSTGLLFDRPLSRLTGFNSLITNLASMDNSGVEILLNGSPIQKEDFSWNVSFNITSNKNKIKNMTQDEVTDVNDATKRWKVGSSRYEWYLKEYAGLDPADGAAMWYMDELGADGKPNGNRVTTKNQGLATRYNNLGSALPKFTGGLSNTLRYKEFDMSIYTYFSLGNKIYDNLYATLMHNGMNPGQQMSRDVLNAWKNPGDQDGVPRFIPTANSDNSNTQSSRFLFNGSYLRVKNITLGYSLNKKLINPLQLSSLRIYVMAENPFTFAAHKGLDPEVDMGGLSNNDIPNIKTFSVGLSVGF
ncbi:SusC/RagA family TonB-linked outer membrane protein [Pedobacter caeni]|uniref:TonB-linked outer membrane protein, SusC/RagA family n=1 Tax=Pedobacter caeni TaxID=288992 RepID=A0A1M5JFF4_9SPHI|nr:TonB-dependent receptor [Pedobacter caeni]SHG39009.1 TonB-linked outer membrane protein, SusC/RagA family [Pedobacter caeni]